MAAGLGARYLDLQVDIGNKTISVGSIIDYKPYRDLQATGVWIDKARRYFIVTARTQPHEGKPDKTAVLYYPILISVSESAVSALSGGLALPFGTAVAFN